MGNRMNLLEHMRVARLVPVADVASPADAAPLARALLDGGLGCMEVTFRTAAAADAIGTITAEVPEMVVGAGTVRTVGQAELAVEVGAAFLVAPGLVDDVVFRAGDLGVPVLPGVCTPTEIEHALRLGLSLLKFFPAEAAGGVACLKALAGPYGEVRFVATGGIGPGNVAAYLDLPTVVACGGSWMVKSSLIAAGDFASITRLTAEAVAVVGAAVPASS